MFINHVWIGGKITNEPLYVVGKNGMPFFKFRLSVYSRFYTWGVVPKHASETHIHAYFLDEAAEAANKLLKKGDYVAVTGMLETKEWQDKKTGERKSEIRIAGISFLPYRNVVMKIAEEKDSRAG